jgi:hypothetical protein
MNLDAILNKCVSYDKVLEEAGFKHNGDGIKPWSLRYTHADGRHIDVRSSDWTAYPENIEGDGPENLKKYLFT